MEFRKKIRAAADNYEIYRNYKKDRRDVMDQCHMKGEDYEAEKKEKQEIFLTSMKFYVWGVESLTKKEVKLLKNEGVIKPNKKLAQEEEGYDEAA